MELNALLPGNVHRNLYRILYDRRGNPPTIAELQSALPPECNQIHFSRRLRELRGWFIIPTATAGNNFTYKLESRRDRPLADTHISLKVRAFVLRHARCEMCGRTPAEDHVRLHVDHKVPRERGGSSEVDNLQALCSDCNEGKKAHFCTGAPVRGLPV